MRLTDVVVVIFFDSPVLDENKDEHAVLKLAMVGSEVHKPIKCKIIVILSGVRLHAVDAPLESSV
ncbi:MAG: hypothetical protein CMM90_02610 [Rickettsiales bacterium]|nr:hypothetical protein [Rickettsiales bacterium]